MNIKIVDARGEACPLPVVRATKALAEMTAGGTLEVHVDNDIAVQNVRRMAEGKDLSCRTEEAGERHFVLTIDVPAGNGAVSPDAAPSCAAAPCKNGTVVVFDGTTMGRGDEALGKTLLKGFIYALSQLDVPPETLLFYNGGAPLTCEGSPALDDLKSMASQGTEILTCGTCLDYYGLKESLRVGSVTNMYTITETLAHAVRIIKP